MKEAVGNTARIGFALAVIVLVVSGWLSYENIQKMGRTGVLVVHTHEVLDEIRETLKSLAETESGQRNFLITGGASYLDYFEASAQNACLHVAQIRALTVDNPSQQARFTKLEPLLLQRLTTMREGIGKRETGGVPGAAQHVLLDRGRQEMAGIRKLMASMEQEELRLLEIRENESHGGQRTALLTVLLTTLLGLALVGAAYRITSIELMTRQRGAEALARANDELESRVERRTADLNLANESLQRSNRELEQFASVASHDLQEPLRKIQAFGDRLQTRCAEGLGEQGRDYLVRMLASATRMRSLIDALLSFSRITTKAQPFVPVDLAATVEDVVSDLEDRIQRMGGRVEVGSMPSLEADPLQMRQLLQNLIGNGLKFARPDAPPVVKVESRLLNENSENGEVPMYEISVRDNGIGFEEVYLDRIFELFQRLHGRQEYEGTGMGLAICRKIVERHGGTITARSSPERGATFLVNLPMRQQ